MVDALLANPTSAEIIRTLNPDFQPPQRPFLRLDYRDAIKYLNEHSITKEDGSPHVVGDDIAEAAERKMTDQINRPIMMIHFPKAIKSFYMKAVPDAPDFTESVDVLVPGVGEVVGGSMRIADLEELLAGVQARGHPYGALLLVYRSAKVRDDRARRLWLGCRGQFCILNGMSADGVAVPCLAAEEVYGARVFVVSSLDG